MRAGSTAIPTLRPIKHFLGGPHSGLSTEPSELGAWHDSLSGSQEALPAAHGVMCSSFQPSHQRTSRPCHCPPAQIFPICINHPIMVPMRYIVESFFPQSLPRAISAGSHEKIPSQISCPSQRNKRGLVLRHESTVSDGIIATMAAPKPCVKCGASDLPSLLKPQRH